MNPNIPGHVYDRDMRKLTEQFKNLKTPKKAWVLSILKPIFEQFNEKSLINPLLNNGEEANTEHISWCYFDVKDRNFAF